MKTILIILIVHLIVLLTACKNTTDSISADSDINVIMKSYEIYEFRTGISGDEEEVVIITQSKNYDISEIVRNTETNFEAVYRYKPRDGFIGTDFVEIKKRTGSDGASPHTKFEVVKITIKVTF